MQISILHERGIQVTLWEVHGGWEIPWQPFLKNTVRGSGAWEDFLPTVEGEESGYLLKKTQAVMP